MALLRRHLRCAEYTHTFATAPRIAEVFLRAMWRRGLPLSEPFGSHVLFFLLHRCELRTVCNSFAIVARAVPERYNANAMRAPSVVWL